MKEKILYKIIFILMSICVLGIVIWSGVHYGHVSPISEAEEHLEPIEDGWINAQGEPVDVSNLQKLEGVEPGKPFSVYYTLPDDLGEGNSLCFRSKNITVQVYADGQCLYESDVPGAALNSDAVGTNWNYVDLPSSCAGKQLEVRVTTAYVSAKARMDNIYLGSDRESLLSTIYSKSSAIVTCMLFLFVGVLLILADIPVNVGRQKNHELLYLGLFSLVIALWCCMETYVIQIFLGDARTVHIASCCLLMLLPVAVVRYLYEAYGESIRYMARAVIVLSVIEFILNIVLQLTGVADFQQTLRFSHVLLILSAIILVGTVMYFTIKSNKEDSLLFFKIIRGIGLGSIAVMTVIDIIRFYFGTGEDVGKYVRIGVLIFIICYGGSSLERSMDAIRLGARAEIVSQLAYEDGLTGLGNRTLFKERLAALDEQKIKDQLEIAIIMFDVNNLKVVNDRLGHQIGDNMLVKSAELIQSTFGAEGECFRVGGDEFVAIINGNHVEARYEICQKQFDAAVEEYNAIPNRIFTIRIAYGCGIYKPGMGAKRLNDIYVQADAKMYNHKKYMKARTQEEVIVNYGETTKLFGGLAKGETGKIRENY